MIDAARGLDLFSLKDQVFVVTGSSGGIGLEIAKGLAAAGARVGLNGRHRESLVERAERIPNSFVLPFDVRDEAAASGALEDAVRRLGRLDGIVCNRGCAEPAAVGRHRSGGLSRPSGNESGCAVSARALGGASYGCARKRARHHDDVSGRGSRDARRYRLSEHQGRARRTGAVACRGTRQQGHQRSTVSPRARLPPR